MSSRVIQSIVPPGGWHYIQDGVRVPPERADSFDDLLKRVLQFRINNRIPVGDVFNDVQNYICQFNNQCHGVYTGVGTPDPVQPQKPRFIDRLIHWADDIRSKGVALEDGQRYSDRVNVCKNCPRAKSWDGQCPACSSHLHQVLTLIKKGRSTHDATLGCDVHGFDCDTASMMSKTLLPVPEHNAPDQCWMRQ
jgi:hypothetical protein